MSLELAKSQHTRQSNENTSNNYTIIVAAQTGRGIRDILDGLDDRLPRGERLVESIRAARSVLERDKTSADSQRAIPGSDPARAYRARCDDAAHRDARQLITVPGNVDAPRWSAAARREILQSVILRSRAPGGYRCRTHACVRVHARTYAPPRPSEITTLHTHTHSATLAPPRSLCNREPAYIPSALVASGSGGSRFDLSTTPVATVCRDKVASRPANNNSRGTRYRQFPASVRRGT